MSKFTAKKRMNNTVNPDFKCPSGYQLIKSFNDETTYSKETKFLIVGTLTPPDGRGETENKKFLGYFYCSERNDMYEFIDGAFKERKTKLLDLKNNFRESNWNLEVKEKIKTELSARGVAFLDVVDEAYTLPNNADDDAIHSYKYDYKAFRNVKFDDPNLKIIANSKNAKIALEHIIDELEISDCKKQQYKERIKCVPQLLRGNYKDYHTKDDLKAEWKKVLSK